MNETAAAKREVKEILTANGVAIRNIGGNARWIQVTLTDPDQRGAAMAALGDRSFTVADLPGTVFVKR